MADVRDGCRTPAAVQGYHTSSQDTTATAASGSTNQSQETISGKGRIRDARIVTAELDQPDLLRRSLERLNNNIHVYDALTDDEIDEEFSRTSLSLEKAVMPKGCEELLHKALGSPSKAYHIVHVTGTNGKGTACHKIALEIRRSSLRKFNVGIATSPHIFECRERFRINDELISKRGWLACYVTVLEVGEEVGVKPKFFLFQMNMALLWFAYRRVDIAVIEVGLGGRRDPTNVIDPPLCTVITSVGYDHMAPLGNTRKAIACNKAGIIKRGSDCVIGPECLPRKVFEDEFESVNKGLPQKPEFVNLANYLEVVASCSVRDPDSCDLWQESALLAQVVAGLVLRRLKIAGLQLPALVRHNPPCRYQRLRPRTLELVRERFSADARDFPSLVVFDAAHNITAVQKTARLFYNDLMTLWRRLQAAERRAEHIDNLSPPAHHPLSLNVVVLFALSRKRPLAVMQPLAKVILKTLSHVPGKREFKYVSTEHAFVNPLSAVLDDAARGIYDCAELTAAVETDEYRQLHELLKKPGSAAEAESLCGSVLHGRRQAGAKRQKKDTDTAPTAVLFTGSFFAIDDVRRGFKLTREEMLMDSQRE